MHRFQICISRILLLVLFFQEGLFSVYAIDEAQYSLDALPFGDISVPEGAPLSLDNPEDRRLVLESMDGQYSDSNNPKDEAGKRHIEFTYTGVDEVRTLLAQKVAFEKTPQISPDSDVVFYQLPSIFQSGGIMPFDFFLGKNTLVEGSGTNPSFSDIVDIPLPVYKSDKFMLDKKSRKSQKLSNLRGGLSYEMESGTVIRTSSGEIIEMAQIGFSELHSTKLRKAKTKYEAKMKNRGVKRKGFSEAQVEGFEFGFSGVHLLFSKPVKVVLDVPMMSDGNILDILTMHAGDSDFHTGGLSVNPSTLCNENGTASIPGSTVTVKNGRATFYTCGASSFTLNPSGGTVGSNDIRIIVGDCAQAQIYYNNLSQIYSGNPAANGCGLPGLWAALRIGATTYGNGVDGVTATAWSTQSTTGSTSGNTYRATSTMTRVVGGLTYTLIIDWFYTAPNKYLQWSYKVIIPTGNTANVRFYFGNDSYVAGADANDVGYISSTGGLTVGVYDNVANVLSAFRYLSGAAWTAHEVGPYGTVASRITNGVDFANTVQNTAGDLGFGVDWNLGNTPKTYSGTVEWRLLPYVSTPVADLIPGIGLPEGPLTTNLLSQLPITISNAGNLSSSGVHTVIFTVPTNITGPTSSFTDNGWSCGAQIGTGVTCTKTTSVTGSLAGDESLRIPITPTLAASGTSVTFYVDISGGGDSNLTNNRAFSANAVIGGGPANDPGGISGENLWLMGNNGTNCTTTGCTVTSWANRGGLGASASGTSAVGTVVYDPANSINYNPTLYFNNASLNTNNTLGITASSASIFTVTRISTGGTFPIGPQTAVANALQRSTSPTTDVWQRYAGLVFYNGANARSANVPAITTTLRQTTGTSSGYTNGKQVLSSNTAGNFTAANIGIGRVVGTNATLTNLAEVIVYPNGLNDAQRLQVESYLAIKYGITLDQTLPTNYLGSNGSIIWNATTAGVYKNNIAGIARDDATTLNQNRSRSVSSLGDIIVSKSAIGTNRNALLWANDLGNTLAFTGNDIGSGYQRIAREWLFQEKNGDIGNVTLSYPNSSVPVGFTGTLMLFTDMDGLFAVGASAYTGTYNSAQATWDFNVNISDLQYVTFGKVVPVDSTPPVITSINISSGTLIPKGTFSLTLNYADTGVGINPASFSGRIYPWNATGSTWSATNIAGSYMLYSGIPNATSGGFDITNLPYGKYRFDISISDLLGNTVTQSYTYYVDEIEWILSTPIYDIGTTPTGMNTFGSGDLLLTVKTIGAGFNLTLQRSSDLTYSGQTVTVYNGTNGWGYDKDIGAGYSTILTPHATPQTIIAVAKNINTNGFKNTFTYRVKFGSNPTASSLAGDYQGSVAFGINLNY